MPVRADVNDVGRLERVLPRGPKRKGIGGSALAHGVRVGRHVPLPLGSPWPHPISPSDNERRITDTCGAKVYAIACEKNQAIQPAFSNGLIGGRRFVATLPA